MMDSAEELIYPPEATTPEPQRLNTHMLGGHPSDGISRLEHKEETAGNAVRENRENPQIGFDKNNTDGAHTPPTVCRNSWLQLQRQDDGPKLWAGAADLHSHAGEGFFQPSPASLAPSTEGLTDLRCVRSASCPLGNRSAAPARYSTECNLMSGGDAKGASASRHTTLLDGGGIHDFPGATKPSTAAATVADCAAARPTILIHVATPPLRRSGVFYASSGFIPREGNRNVSRSRGDIHGHHHTHSHNPVGHSLCARARAETSATRLTRFSGGSSYGDRSPGLSGRIGRPTTLQCPDVDLGGRWQWGDDGEGERWVGGATEVWRNSAEMNGLAVTTEHFGCATAGLHDEEEIVVVAPAAPCDPQRYSPSPQATRQTLTLLGRPSHIDVHRRSDHPTFLGEDMASEEDAEAPDGTTKPDPLTSAVQNASLTGLADAPRKSYARSTANSPTNGGVEGGGNTGVPTIGLNTVWREAEDGLCLPSNDVVVMRPRNVTELTTRAAAEIAPMTINTNQQHGWLYQNSSVVAGNEVRDDVAAPQEWSCVFRAHPAVTGANAVVADVVAAQLARLSLQASPTQKRLAFEEEDDDGFESSNSSSPEGNGYPTTSSAPTRSPATTGARSGESSISTANCVRGETAFGLLGPGCAREGNVVHKAAATANRRTGGGRMGSLSGLQLLRSRKRCLEEMQATDAAKSTPCTAALSHIAQATEATKFAGSVGAVVGTPLQDLLKRQKREEPYNQREQHLLAGEGNAEDIIPTPMHAGAAPSVYSSAPSFLLQQNTYTREGIPHPQHQPLQGDTRNWSQLSSITYVTPVSQSPSTGMMGILSYSSVSQREGCPAIGSNGVVTCTSSSCSQVLSSLPTNVTQRYLNVKQ